MTRPHLITTIILYHSRIKCLPTLQAMHSKSSAAELFLFRPTPLSSYYIYMAKTTYTLLLLLFAAIITTSQFSKCPAANSLQIASGTTLYIQTHSPSVQEAILTSKQTQISSAIITLSPHHSTVLLASPSVPI